MNFQIGTFPRLFLFLISGFRFSIVCAVIKAKMKGRVKLSCCSWNYNGFFCLLSLSIFNQLKRFFIFTIFPLTTIAKRKNCCHQEIHFSRFRPTWNSKMILCRIKREKGKKRIDKFLSSNILNVLPYSSGFENFGSFCADSPFPPRSREGTLFH